MNIIFNKIPTLAKVFYLVGFIIIAAAMALYFYFPTLLDVVVMQQAFILGAIIVALGSVVNTMFQFKRPKRNKKD